MEEIENNIDINKKLLDARRKMLEALSIENDKVIKLAEEKIEKATYILSDIKKQA